MRFVTLSIVIFLALAAIEAAPKSSLDSGYSRKLKQWRARLFGRSVDPIDGDLIGRSLDGIGGGNLVGRSVDPIDDGDLFGRSVDPIDDGDLFGRSVDPIDGDLIGRSLDRIGGGNLVGRSVDPIDDGDLFGRSVDPIDGDLIGRSLDRIGGGNLVGRSVDPIDGDLIGRSLDRIGGGNLVGRSLSDIRRRKQNAYEDVLIGQKRNFGVLQLGGGYGVAKRAQSSKYETKSEKHRRGPLNGLIPGGAFGRAARSCIKINCHPSEKLIKLLKDRLENQYFSFDVDSDRQATKDGQVKTPIGVYKTYQLMEIE